MSYILRLFWNTSLILDDWPLGCSSTSKVHFSDLAVSICLGNQIPKFAQKGYSYERGIYHWTWPFLGAKEMGLRSSDAQIQKQRPVLVANYPQKSQKWWITNFLFHDNIHDLGFGFWFPYIETTRFSHRATKMIFVFWETSYCSLLVLGRTGGSGIV